MREETWGGLEVRIVGGTDGRGGGAGPLVVLLHGFGAPGDDLVPLAGALRVARDVRFAFPEAPIDLGPEAMGGRAWWWIDMETQLARMRGMPIDRTHSIPEGLGEARAKVNALLDTLQRELAPSELVLGGFSQGAMLACDVALRSTRPLRALAMLSGTLIAQQEWEPVVRGRAGLPTLVSHGQADPVLPFAAAEKLRDFLSTAGLTVTWVPFRGGHEIPRPVLESLATLIVGAQ